jgi:uncharacterized protein YjbI with pentapeptide repeats
MANSEQLAILKRGVEVWNEWREKNPSIDIDLERADLRGVRLRGANLRGAILVRALLLEVDLHGAMLADADLAGANLWRASLVRAHLLRAYIPRTYLVEANLQESDLSNVSFESANLMRADLGRANLMEADLTRTNLSGANFLRANLRKAILMETNGEKANFTEADLEATNLWRANLWGAKLIEANLKRADLSRTVLERADLSRADLRGVIFTETDLEASNLTEANLTGVNLRDAYLWGAQLLDARLQETSLPDLTRRRERRDSLALQLLKEIRYYPDEVSFTAIYPKEGKIDTWHTLLVYAHLISAIEDIHRDADRFRDQIQSRKETKSNSSTSIVRGTDITIVPSCNGLEFNPERIVLKWMERFHRADFRFRADKSLAHDAARGQIDIYVRPIVVGKLKFAILLNERDVKTAENNEEHCRIYHQEDIFVSYSHKDSHVVLACKKAYEALGFNVLLDIDTLRSGQAWNEELMHMIERATIFQLFWSKNSRQSKYCCQEWGHALKLNKDGFIRPVYWEIPMPDPPEELRKLHFAYTEF